MNPPGPEAGPEANDEPPGKVPNLEIKQDTQTPVEGRRSHTPAPFDVVRPLAAGLHRPVVVILLLLVCLLGGCRSVPAGRDAVTAVKVDGVDRHHRTEVEAGLSTRASSKLLWLIPGVYEYETLDDQALQKDLERAERQLRRRGYYEARVYAARIIHVAENKVRVEIEIEPGEVVTIGEVRTIGLSQLPFDAASDASSALRVEVEQTFDEDEFEQGKQDIANALADAGYAFVRVKGSAEVDLSNHKAKLLYQVKPGPRAHLGKVTIEGLKDVPEGPVRSALQLEEGDLYSRRDLDLARSALFRLGAFARVDITADLENPDAKIVPLTVKLEESALKSVSAGAGVTLDVLRLAAHGRISWTHQNFLGGLRKFTISDQPGVTLFPTRIDNITAPTTVLPENSLTVRLEQPSFIEGRTRGFVETGYNVYPLLYPLPEGLDPNLETVIGYNEITSSVGVERLFLGHRLPVTLSYNWRANFPFAYQGEIVDGLSDVIVSYPELITLFDLRDDPISPTKGLVLSNSFQVANGSLGGSVIDLRLKPEARAYVPLNFSKSLVLATRVTLGMVFPQNYGDALLNAGGDLNFDNPATIEDQHKLLFRAFYSGGPNSNRGYPYQRMGPQGAIGFLVPTGVNCNQPPELLPSSCIRPLGGFSLWEASLELRWKISGPIGAVLFIDTSDVSSQIATFTLNQPHVSVGPGFRYASPVGPIRVDVGFPIPGLQTFGEAPNEPPDISEVAPYVNSFRPAVHILIGEAF